MLAASDLPPQLSERLRTLRNGQPLSNGEFVLYWMHHAVRAHENPALEVAIRAANALRCPVLVYQGLGGRHAYNSDRHHTFILEGAREVQVALRPRGISYAFHLARDPTEGSPLRGLAQRSALVVVEDFPAPPFPSWTRRLAESVSLPVWAVDCECIVPMRLLKKSYARAFEFRRASAKLYETRLDAVWEEAGYEGAKAPADLGFEPVDLERADSGLEATTACSRHTR